MKNKKDKESKDEDVEPESLQTIKDELLIYYTRLQVEFELRLHKRRIGINSNLFDEEMTKWCVSTHHRWGFARLMVSAALNNKPVRQSVISSEIGTSYQSVMTILKEAISLGYAVEKRKNLYQGSPYLVAGARDYTESYHDMVSSELIEIMTKWEVLKNLTQPKIN